MFAIVHRAANLNATASASQRRLLVLFCLRLEEGIDGLLRVTNDEPFFLWSSLPLSWRCFLGHQVLLSSRFLMGGVPQPGIEPGRPKWAPACKAGLTAISSTGGSKALNVGTGDPSECAVPTRSGPISVALKPSSFDPSSTASERNIVVGDFCRLREIVHFVPTIKNSALISLPRNLTIGIIREPTKNLVNRRHWSRVPRQIKSVLHKGAAHILRSHARFRLLQGEPDRICDAQRGEVFRDRYSSQGREVIQHLVQVFNLSFYFTQRCFEVRAFVDELVLLVAQFVPSFHVIFLLYSIRG